MVLDYIIRNTDRGNDNWLIKYEAEAERGLTEPSEWGARAGGVPAGGVHIAAIDNGLAFPFKHPDSWRAYPYHWAWLPHAKRPFSRATRDLVLPLLSDMTFVQELVDDLHALFRVSTYSICSISFYFCTFSEVFLS